jgi:uracil-DNA glycosylase
MGTPAKLDSGIGRTDPGAASELDRLLVEIRSCTYCAAALPLGPRPIVQAGAGARLLIIGQAPGTRVHETGVPWNDPSGRRLREWIAVDDATFYDRRRVALMGMGFCYPGRDRNGGDAPPRPECAPLWHDRLRRSLEAPRLTLLVGGYAQKAYLETRGASLADTLRLRRAFPRDTLALPHPSWRNNGWIRRNPWFADEILPLVRERVRAALGQQNGELPAPP